MVVKRPFRPVVDAPPSIFEQLHNNIEPIVHYESASANSHHALSEHYSRRRTHIGVSFQCDKMPGAAKISASPQ